MAVFGSDQSRPAQWLKAGLAQARRVGRVDIRHEGTLAVGSGFMVDGGVFDQAYSGLPLFLTARHVLPPYSGAAVPLPVDATIVFEGMFDDTSLRITAAFRRVLAESSADRLNYAVLLLDRWPGTVPDLLLAPQLPAAGERVFVASYPLGGGLALSLSDNDVVAPPPEDAAERAGGANRQRLLYYRAPTAPGSSGAPVFNENWEVAGIHIGRRTTANFAVPMADVLADVQGKLAAGSGALVPDDEAGAIRATARPGAVTAAEGDPDYFSVFISYSHADTVFATRLYNALQAQGIRAWQDVKQMLPGDDIYTEVEKGIQRWDKVLLCASRASLTSWWVDSEIDRVFEKERHLFKARGSKVLALIPVMLDDYMLAGWGSGKAQEVKSRIAADFRGWETTFEATFGRLVLALRADAGAREAPPQPKL